MVSVRSVRELREYHEEVRRDGLVAAAGGTGRRLGLGSRPRCFWSSSSEVRAAVAVVRAREASRREGGVRASEASEASRLPPFGRFTSWLR